MPEANLDRTVTLELELAEAIVLYEWLAQMEEPDDPTDLPPFEQAVLRLRWNLVALTETVYFPGEFGNADVEYDDEVDAAIEALRDPEWCESD